MKKLSEIDLGWVCGLLEGEGSFLVSYKQSTNGTMYPTGRIQCNMTDEDTLIHLQEVLGVGCLRGPLPPKSDKHKPVFRFGINKREDILSVLKVILPYMMSRRAIQVQTVIDALDGTERCSPHGSRHRYERLNCRCAVCKAANAKHHREARAERKRRAECLTSQKIEENY